MEAVNVLHNKKQLIPKLRFKGFIDSWKKGTIGDYYENLRTGMTPSRMRPDYFKGNIPWISSGELNYGYIETTTESITKEAVENTNLKIYPPNTLFIAITGLEAPGTRGKCAMNKVPAATNQSCLAFEEIPEVSTLFLFQWYKKNGIWLYYNFAQGTKQQSFNNKLVKGFIFNIPTLPEQQKIASFLSAIDEKIQQLTRKKELLEQYKKGVMQQLFSGKLRFKDEKGKAFPKWEMVGGDKLFDSISDKKHNSDLPILAITQDQGAIPRDMINYHMTVTESSIASYKVVQVGDFIISLRTFQGGIEYSNYKGICSPAYNILRPSSNNVHRDFYKYYLKTPYYIKQLQKNLEGIRDGKMISYKYFSEIKLPFPSLQEQQKIANFITSLDSRIEEVGNQLSAVGVFKKGLLQQMFV